jgi:LPXTG-site transpeptidase (sortase) family protein
LNISPKSLFYSLILVLVLICLIPPTPAHAEIIIVDTNADTIDANGGICTAMQTSDLPGPDGVVSLREAICAANGTPGIDSITFDDNYTITLNNLQLPGINTEIVITGNGIDQTIIQASTCNPITLPGGCIPADTRIFQVSSGDLTINNMTLRYGNRPDNGGAIYNTSSGTLEINNCLIFSNKANHGGGVANNSSITAITGTTFSYNEAIQHGGGLYLAEFQNLGIIENSTFIGNIANSYGGAISKVGGSIDSITGTTFEDNTAGLNGGGIYNINRINSIDNCTFTGNSSNMHGGGLYNHRLFTNISSISNSTFTNNSAFLDGGAIRNNARILSISNCTFSNNNADLGGGYAGHRSYSITSFFNSTFSNNTALNGGAISVLDGTIEQISQSTIFDHVVPGFGGGIYIDSGTINSIDQSTLNSNRATEGGGIYNNGTITSLSNSTLSGNSASDYGGGIFNNAVVGTIASSTMFGNWADDNGGGIYNGNNITSITNSIIVNSTSGGNCRGSSPGSSSYNITDFRDCWGWVDDLIYNQHMAPLADNGGPTQTHALVATSPSNPAINTGPLSCSGAPTNDQDQRGVIRSNYGNCDIGSFEYTGDDTVLTVSASDPMNGSIKTDQRQIKVTFNKDVVSDGGGNAANNPNNYLLIEEGPNAVFDTQSCQGGFQADDTRITISNVSYNGASNTATLDINPSPLPAGDYRLFVCGTTSIHDLIGLKLNGGVSDTLIDFTSVTSLPSTGFRPGVITQLADQPSDKQYANYSDLSLEIPKLGIQLDIVGIPLVDQAWDVVWLGNNAGYLSGTAFPTWQGNTVLTAHVWDAWNRPGPFVNLKSLSYGDYFHIHAFGQVYTYQVQENIRIRPDDLSVLGHTEDDQVTLLTCERWNLFIGEYSFRRAVQAILIEINPE